MTASKCQHMSFSAHVAVNRLEDRGLFMSEITICCDECKLPFQFLGLEAGLHLRGASVSLDGLEARIAIAPQGSVASPIDRIAGAITDIKH